MGKKIGGYDLEETIGVGSYSKVKRAIHEETGRLYAVKVIQKDRIVKDWNRQQLRRELELTRDLSHPNVCHLVEAMQTGRHVYMVFDLAAGGDLYNKITTTKGGRLPLPLAHSYFTQLVAGLLFCHQRHIVHRDLKPENLLLSEDQTTLKISDFGFCAEQKEDQKLFALCGSPHTVAPEVLQSEHGYDGYKSDVWACGVILFVMAAGFYPFNGKTNEELFAQIMKNDFTFPSTFPEDLQALLSLLLQKSPDLRPSLEEVQQHPWFIHGPFSEEIPSASSNLSSCRSTPTPFVDALTEEFLSPTSSLADGALSPAISAS